PSPVGPGLPSGVIQLRKLEIWRTKAPFSSFACTGCQSWLHLPSTSIAFLLCAAPCEDARCFLAMMRPRRRAALLLRMYEGEFRAPGVAQACTRRMILDPNCRCCRAFPNCGKHCRIAQPERHFGQSGHAFRRHARIAAVPDIAGKLVVIATAAEELRAGIVEHQIEAEHAGIEGLRLCRVADLEVHMADEPGLREAVPFPVARLLEQALDIERIGGHPDLAIR